MSDPAVYEIATFDDFLKIPEHLLERCLEEFAQAVISAYHLSKAVDVIAEARGSSVIGKIGAMRFVDDGKKHIILNLSTPDTGEPAQEQGE